MNTPTLEELDHAIHVLDWLHEHNKAAEDRIIDELGSKGMFTANVASDIGVVKHSLAERRSVYTKIVDQLRQLRRLLDQ